MASGYEIVRTLTGFHSVTPRLLVSDVSAELEFLRAAFAR
jgi:hypothetical protein